MTVVRIQIYLYQKNKSPIFFCDRITIIADTTRLSRKMSIAGACRDTIILYRRVVWRFLSIKKKPKFVVRRVAGIRAADYYPVARPKSFKTISISPDAAVIIPVCGTSQVTLRSLSFSGERNGYNTGSLVI